jgi:hypothetical protein
MTLFSTFLSDYFIECNGREKNVDLHPRLQTVCCVKKIRRVLKIVGDHLLEFDGTELRHEVRLKAIDRISLTDASVSFGFTSGAVLLLDWTFV